jgi:hypothetical protein
MDACDGLGSAHSHFSVCVPVGVRASLAHWSSRVYGAPSHVLPIVPDAEGKTLSCNIFGGGPMIFPSSARGLRSRINVIVGLRFDSREASLPRVHKLYCNTSESEIPSWR